MKLGGTVTNVTRAWHGASRAGFRFKGSALTFLHSCRIEFRFLKRCLLDHIPVALLYNLKKKKVHIFFCIGARVYHAEEVSLGGGGARVYHADALLVFNISLCLEYLCSWSSFIIYIEETHF